MPTTKYLSESLSGPVPSNTAQHEMYSVRALMELLAITPDDLRPGGNPPDIVAYWGERAVEVEVARIMNWHPGISFFHDKVQRMVFATARNQLSEAASSLPIDVVVGEIKEGVRLHLPGDANKLGTAIANLLNSIAETSEGATGLPPAYRPFTQPVEVIFLRRQPLPREMKQSGFPDPTAMGVGLTPRILGVRPDAQPQETLERVLTGKMSFDNGTFDVLLLTTQLGNRLGEEEIEALKQSRVGTMPGLYVVEFLETRGDEPGPVHGTCWEITAFDWPAP